MRKTLLIVGADGGLGSAVCDALSADGVDFFEVAGPCSPKVDFGVDLTDKNSIGQLAMDLDKAFDPHHTDRAFAGIVNCAGVNMINPIPYITEEDWQRTMDINVTGFFFLCQSLLPLIERDGVICNVISNASHMPMTHSAAYNASKGAAHILTKQMGRELRKSHGITVFGVSPNKLHGTRMSKDIDKRVCELRGWTPEEARQYQLASLPSGAETSPAAVGEFIASLVGDRDMYRHLNCCVMPFGD